MFLMAFQQKKKELEQFIAHYNIGIQTQNFHQFILFMEDLIQEELPLMME